MAVGDIIEVVGAIIKDGDRYLVGQRAAFKAQADALIVAHNHPSGDPTPNKADLQLTSALQSTARLLGIKFIDHLILGSADCEDGKGYVSVVEFEN